jgi:hypothetical protein
VEPEQQRRDAVRKPHGDDAERPACLQRDPHQRDVVEGVAELAGRDRQEQAPEVGPSQEAQRRP